MPNRTSLLGDLLTAVVKRRRSLFDRSETVATPGEVVDCFNRLLSSVGEASGIALARMALDGYSALGDEDKALVLSALREQFNADESALKSAVKAYGAAPSAATIGDLHRASEPRRQELLRRLNQTPGGTADLVSMRADLLKLLRRDSTFAGADEDFLHLFSSWFNRGFLQMRRIDWNTSASVLERIIRYEAVHEIQDWDDLRRRVDAEDRRLYAFFHPSLDAEPLIFVEVALTDGIPPAIDPILSADRTQMRPDDANAAIFYAISNCQAGLRGVSFGSFLIKQVAAELQSEFPKIKTFSTLSPLPGLRRWLESQGGDGGGLPEELQEAAHVLSQNQDTELDARQEAGIQRLVAAYLLLSNRGDGQSVDPVCRFHLGNGARLERINLSANTSERGQLESFGVMVNYVYDLDEVETNHEDYANRGIRHAAGSILRSIKGLSTDTGPEKPAEVA